MSTGTPLSLRCPRCMCGKWNHGERVLGCRRTGRVEKTVRRSAHKGSGKGGVRFVGHRGEVHCRDCGHYWFSTHPRSGRLGGFQEDPVAEGTVFITKPGQYRHVVLRPANETDDLSLFGVPPKDKQRTLDGYQHIVAVAPEERGQVVGVVLGLPQEDHFELHYVDVLARYRGAKLGLRLANRLLESVTGLVRAMAITQAGYNLCVAFGMKYVSGAKGVRADVFELMKESGNG